MTWLRQSVLVVGVLLSIHYMFGTMHFRIQIANIVASVVLDIMICVV